MAVEIRRATSAELLGQAFRLRREVFVGEGIVRGDQRSLMYDVFDTIDETAIYVVLDGEQVIGTVRGTRASSLGLPADQYFDFRPHLSSDVSRTGNASMLCVAPAYRSSPANMLLVEAVHRWAISEDVTELVACMRPEAAPMVERIGGVVVGAPFDHPVEGVPVVPMSQRIAGDVSPFVAGLRAGHLDLTTQATEPLSTRST